MHKPSYIIPDPNPCFIEQGKEGPITQIGGWNSLENLCHGFRLERARFPLDLRGGVETFHRVRLDHSMTNEPVVEGAEGTVAPSSCCGTQMLEAGEKCLDRVLGNQPLLPM